MTRCNRRTPTVCSLTDCLPFPTTNPMQNQITRGKPRTPKRLPACLPSRTTNPESDGTLQLTNHEHQDATSTTFHSTPHHPKSLCWPALISDLRQLQCPSANQNTKGAILPASPSPISNTNKKSNDTLKPKNTKTPNALPVRLPSPKASPESDNTLKATNTKAPNSLPATVLDITGSFYDHPPRHHRAIL